MTAQDWEAVRAVVLDGRVASDPRADRANGRDRLRTHLVLCWRRAIHRRQRTGSSSRPPKWDSLGFARGLATEFAPHNIRVNVVSPGIIDTKRANPEWYQGRTANRSRHSFGTPRDGRRDRRHVFVPCQRRQWFHHRPDDSRQWWKCLLLILLPACHVRQSPDQLLTETRSTLTWSRSRRHDRDMLTQPYRNAHEQRVSGQTTFACEEIIPV